jgi:hypothetical protein
MSRPKIGKPGSGDRKKKNYFSIEDGSNVYGILPPLFDLADDGKWSEFHRVEFGYKNSEGYMRPFLSPRVINFKTKMVEVESAAHVKRTELKEQFDSFKKNLPDLIKSGEISKGDAEDQLKELKGAVIRYNLESKHHLNVINQEGEIGLLKIPNRAMQGLRSLMKELRTKGKEVIPYEEDASGLYINFHREGRGLDTVYTVSVVQKTVEVEGEQYEKDVKWTLSESVIDRLNDEAFELNKLYPAPSAEEVERIVNEGPAAVDELLSRNNSNEKSDSPKAEAKVEAKAETKKVEKKAEKKVEAKVEEVSDEEDSEDVLDMMDKAEEKKSSSKKEALPKKEVSEKKAAAPKETAPSDDEGLDEWLDSLEDM